MKKTVIAVAMSGVLVLLLGPGLLAMAAWASVSAMINAASRLDRGPVSSAGAGAIPSAMLALYAQGAVTCPGMSWTVLAAIGTVESSNGTSDLPGVRSGHNAAGAEGPMQFEPATFAEYDRPVPAGGVSPPSPYDARDAVFAAARMLCADGAGTPARLAQAIYEYNHSGSYVATVLAQAETYGFSPAAGGSDIGIRAAEYALAQVGAPYRWGGEDPGVGFDCSGLAQAAWAAAGVELPRVAQDQFAAGPVIPLGAPLQPGDLVFFGSAPGYVSHVGVVLDPSGVMVDAPHTGAFVRVESFPLAVGARWGGEILIGATRPGGRSL